MLPCTLPDAGVTILIVPLGSLHGDMLQHVREIKNAKILRQHCEEQEWNHGDRECYKEDNTTDGRTREPITLCGWNASNLGNQGIDVSDLSFEICDALPDASFFAYLPSVLTSCSCCCRPARKLSRRLVELPA
jgi:hypothetical protein